VKATRLAAALIAGTLTVTLSACTEDGETPEPGSTVTIATGSATPSADQPPSWLPSESASTEPTAEPTAQSTDPSGAASSEPGSTTSGQIVDNGDGSFYVDDTDPGWSWGDPPPGGPSTEDLNQANRVGMAFWEAFSEWGAGDAEPWSSMALAAEYTTGDLKAYLDSLVAGSQDGSLSVKAWNEMVADGKRMHIEYQDTKPVPMSWTDHDMVVFRYTYHNWKAAPNKGPEIGKPWDEYVDLTIVRTDDGWKVSAYEKV